MPLPDVRSNAGKKRSGRKESRAPLRVALIGAGGAGKNLAACVANSKGMAVPQVICDIKPAAAELLKKEIGFKFSTTDYRKAIDREDVDVVLVAVPSGFHRSITVFAAEHGKHVLCEKPIAVELSQADEMIDACREHGVALMIAYQCRYGDNRLTLRSLLLDGAIGRPVFWREVLPLYGEAPAQEWLGNPDLGGGSLFEYSHSVDFACYVFGKPRRVYANLLKMKENPKWRAHDSYNVQITFDSGDLYHLSGFGMLPVNRDEAQAFGGSHRTRTNDVVGPAGAIYMGPDETGRTGMVVSEHVGSSRQKITTYPWEGWAGYSVSPRPAMLADFCRAVRSGKFGTRNRGSEARQTLAILRAAVESSRTGRVVDLE